MTDGRITYNHLRPRLSDLEERMVAGIPPGGNWRHIPTGLSARVDQIKKRSENGIVHTTYYGRLRWDAPSYTINTYFSRIGNGCFLHPAEPRLISIREGARLQTFPDHVRFMGPKRSQYEQVGNAVPPLLGYAVANTLSGQSVVDLFCGAGGLSLGFEAAGFEVVFAADSSDHACETFNLAHRSPVAVTRDLSALGEADIVADAIRGAVGGQLDVLVAGPPCQGFSTAGKRLRSDPRSRLFDFPFDVARLVRPRAVVIENVRGILSIDARKIPGYVADRFAELGYRTTICVLHAEEYGVPQRRTRVFFVATQELWTAPVATRARRDDSLLLPGPATVADAISDLPDPLCEADSDGTITVSGGAKSRLQQWLRGEAPIDGLLAGISETAGTISAAA
jgi:DNA (cytosine-5)-methyltransferase 1